MRHGPVIDCGARRPAGNGARHFFHDFVAAAVFVRDMSAHVDMFDLCQGKEKVLVFERQNISLRRNKVPT